MGKRKYDSWESGQVFKQYGREAILKMWNDALPKPTPVNDKHTDHIGLWQLNKLRTMKTINEINTDLTEGKLLMAALAVISGTTEFSDKTPDEILTELNEAADGMFAATGQDLSNPEIVSDDQEIDKDNSAVNETN